VADGVSAERAARFDRAAGEWLQDAARLLAEGGHAPECRACPVCRGVTVLRQLGPDLLDQVARVASDLATSLREQAAGSVPEGTRENAAEASTEETAGGDARQASPHAGRAPGAVPPWWGRPPGAGEVPRTEWIDITD
jgi:hypothetical protein